MKYELTEETKIVDGITFKRIRYLIDLPEIHAGDLGGWVESERNLSHYENAQVSGNAQVFGNAQVSRTPLQITGPVYNTLICDKFVSIGCKQYPVSDWEKFTDTEISAMDSQALEFWNAWKPVILAAARSHQSV